MTEIEGNRSKGRPRYLLAIRLKADGSTWFATRDPSRSGPLRTKDPLLAQSWESRADIVEWLASIPEVDFENKPSRHREWLGEVELSSVEVSAALANVEAI